MTVLFWILAGLILYAYLGYPLVLSLLSLAGGRQSHRDENFEPTVSLLIPAFNEASVISSKIQNSLALEYPPEKLQIIVASESDDETNSIVEFYRPEEVTLLTSSVRRGKATNLYRAVP